MSDRRSQAANLPLAAVFPPLVIGWREVFVPLAVVAHSLHGQVLLSAGLAVAAARLGSWLLTYGTAHRAVRPAGLVAGLALALIGLAPEEGPLSVLLWTAFGFGWPVLERGLTARSGPARSILPWLLLGMVLAAPLAAGPGTWAVAAGCLLAAWWLGEAPAEDAASAPPPAPRSTAPGQGRLRLLLAFYTMLWLWLVPARLLAGGLPLLWVGVAFGTGWATRWLAAAWIQRRPAAPGRWPAVAAALLAPITLALAWGGPWWLVTLLLALQGVPAGILLAAVDLGRPADALRPDRATAAGEVAGPVAGAVLVLIGGPVAAFAGGAVAAVGLAAASVMREK